MALFRPGFDLEAGNRVAEPLHGNGVVQPFGPPLLTFRHRAQGSQRFILGKYAKHELTSPAMSLIFAEQFRRPPFTSLYCVAGVIILLFLAGMVPFSSLIFLLLALFVLASCLQYNAIVRQEAEQQTQQDPGIQLQSRRNAESFHQAAVLSMMGTLGLQSPALNNLRLAMLNREFNDTGNTIAASKALICHSTAKHDCNLMF